MNDLRKLTKYLCSVLLQCLNHSRQTGIKTIGPNLSKLVLNVSLSCYFCKKVVERVTGGCKCSCTVWVLLDILIE